MGCLTRDYRAVKGSRDCVSALLCRSLPPLPTSLESRGPVLSQPAECLRGLPSSLSHTSIDEDTIRLVWGFATKTWLQLTFLSRSLCSLRACSGDNGWLLGKLLPLSEPLFPLSQGQECLNSVGLPEVTHPSPHFSLWRERRCFAYKTLGLPSVARTVCCLASPTDSPRRAGPGARDGADW